MATRRVNKREKNAKAVKRGGRGRPFGKGNQAAKGHGRPKLPPGYDEAMDIMEPVAWLAIYDIISDADHPRRGQEAEYVINRRRGMPVARAEVTGRNGGPITTRTEMTTEEARAELAALIAEAKGVGVRVADEPEGSKPDGDAPDEAE